MAITFEGYERRIDKINKTCAEYGIADLEEARKICTDLGFDPYQITEGIHGLVPCGTTGESATLTHEEHERVIDEIINNDFLNIYKKVYRNQKNTDPNTTEVA